MVSSCRSSTDEAVWVGIWKRKLEPADRRWRLACVCVSIHLNLTLPSNEPCAFFNTVTPLFLHGVATDPKLQALFSLYLPILFWVHTQVGAHPGMFVTSFHHCTAVPQLTIVAASAQKLTCRSFFVFVAFQKQNEKRVHDYKTGQH